MNITPVSNVLDIAGYNSPALNVLVPNESNYTVFLMQPLGQIEASTNGVRNRDRDLARKQYGRFLDDAYQSHADLVITPEYSMPWETLVNAVKSGIVPQPGKLWVIGCESIKYEELAALKQDISSYATMLYENLDVEPARFLDPLAYVFLAPCNSILKVVILVQFKTYPMGDNDHFEVNGLQLGKCIYKFGGGESSLKLVSIICSDAFKLLDSDAKAIYDRALIIHIQLNPKPRNTQYRMYRNRLLGLVGDQTEIICLNWAMGVEEWCEGNCKQWNNNSASAWYLKSKKFDKRDETLVANHRRGLYYTWLQPLYVHALFFNYQPATYLLIATKVAHIGVPAPISRRYGPKLIKTSIWDDAETVWVEQVAAEDGFTAIVAEGNYAKDEIKRIADRNPLEAERVLALCAGKIGDSDDWYEVRNLDSCRLDSSEVVRRITFCQDTEQSACDFRVARLKRCGHLWNILKSEDHLPPALLDLKKGFCLEWSKNRPHQNVLSESGQHATVIYMGEDASETEIDRIYLKAAEYLYIGFPDFTENHNERQRLAVWYRDNDGEIKQYNRDRFVAFNKTLDNHEFDIARES